MRSLASLLIATAAAGMGCASNEQLGTALVVAGAVTAIAASEAAAGRTCSTDVGTGAVGCRNGTSNSTRIKAATAGVAAGVGLAAVGAALLENGRGADRSSRPAARGAQDPDKWRLRRPAGFREELSDTDADDAALGITRGPARGIDADPPVPPAPELPER